MTSRSGSISPSKSATRNPFATRIGSPVKDAKKWAGRVRTGPVQPRVQYPPPFIPNNVIDFDGPLPTTFEEASLPHEPPHAEPDTEEDTRNHDMLLQFIAHRDEIEDDLFASKSNPGTSKECSCRRPGAYCLIRCENCFGRPPCCHDCFIESHRYMPDHWAKVWNSEGGFFIRHDMSALHEMSSYAFQLGHWDSNQPCTACHAKDFIIVTETGVHGTRIRFCKCPGAPAPYRQLLRAGFFPSTLKDPASAFSLSFLKALHFHTMQGKLSSYDYMIAVRRLTDNAFPEDVPVRLLRM